MIDSNVKVGNVVFAGDLVKVLHGTKYYNITYYDMLSENKVNRHRAHRTFELLSTDYDNFDFWMIDDKEYANCLFIDTGLTADTSAYMHASSEISVNYLSSTTAINPNYSDLYNNLTYVSAINAEISFLRTSCDIDIRKNKDEDGNFTIDYPNHRFLGWKNNDFGDLILPGTIITTNNDLNLVAQWIRQYWLYINNDNIKKGYTKLINFEYITNLSDHHSNMYDNNSILILSACPVEHYHVTKHDISYIYDNYIVNYSITELSSNNTFQLQLSNNILLLSYYDIDQYNITFNVNINKEIVNVYIDSDIISNDNEYALTILKDWNTYITLQAENTDRTLKFLRWDGNIPIDYVYNSTFSINLTYDISATAVFEKANTYSVCIYTNNSNFGTVILNRDPELQQLPYGVYIPPDKGKTFKINVTAIAIDNCQFKGMIDNYGNVYTNDNIVLTERIDKNYQITAYFDAHLIDDNFAALDDDYGINIDDAYDTTLSDISADNTHIQRCYEQIHTLTYSNTLIAMQACITFGSDDHFEHTCNDIIPDVIYTDEYNNEFKLTHNLNYTLEYQDNIVNWTDIKVGETVTQIAHVIITGIGMYNGLVWSEFTIQYKRSDEKIYTITLDTDGGTIVLNDTTT